MKYQGETRTLTLYSEDEAMIGVQTITLSAVLTNYPEIVTNDPIVEASIEIIDQCATLNSIVSPEQTSPEDYFYTGSSPALTFTMNPFIIDPAECGPLLYSCEVISSSNQNVAHNDLCSVNDGSTSG